MSTLHPNFENADPRMRGFRTRTSVERVHEIIDALVVAIGAQSVPLYGSAGRILAERVIADGNVPSFDRSAMDGYALHGEETFGADMYNPAIFRLIGRSKPGEPFVGEVGRGETVAITTGAPIPHGADAVVKVESSRQDGSNIAITEPTPPKRNIGRVGEDIEEGTIVFEPGRCLRPQDLGVLSALGFGRIAVMEKPVVTIIITGDEIDEAGSKSQGCRIADMNGPMLAALVSRDGGIPWLIGPLRDDQAVLRDAISAAVMSSDFVIISGGSSTGPEDHAPSIVAELGDLFVHGVALRPASPSGFGAVGKTPILLAPGNPVSCLCAYDFFGGRIVRKLGGQPVEWPYRSRMAPLADKLSSSLGRVDYVRIKFDEANRVVPMATSGASILSNTTRADGFVVVPSGLEGYASGESVKAWYYDQ